MTGAGKLEAARLRALTAGGSAFDGGLADRAAVFGREKVGRILTEAEEAKDPQAVLRHNIAARAIFR